MRRRSSLALMLALTALVGCAAPSPTPGPTAEPSPEATATPAPTVEPSPTPAPPTATIVPTTPTPAPTPTATPTPERVRVAGTGGRGANLREEPGTQGRALKTLREGAELTIVGPDREAGGRVWRNVRDADDTAGWIVDEALAPVAPPAATPGPAGSPGPSAPAGPAEAAAPCRPGQIKGDAANGLYYRLTHSGYGALRERVRCFDGEAQARAAGFRPAP